MTITVIVKNSNAPGGDRKAVVSTVDTSPDGEVIGSATIAELSGGEEAETYITDTRHVEVREE